MCSQQFQQGHFKQSRVEQQFSGCGPHAGITLETFLDQLLQKKKPPHTQSGHMSLEKCFIYTNRTFKVSFIWFDPWPPSAAGPLVAVWHCWWRPEKHKRTLHSHGFPGAPSTHISTHGHMYSGFTGEASGRSSRQVSPPKHTCQMNRYLPLWWYYHLKWGKWKHNTVTIEKKNTKKH